MWVLPLIGEIEFNFADIYSNQHLLFKAKRTDFSPGGFSPKCKQEVTSEVQCCNNDFINRLITNSCARIPKLDYINSLT